MINLLNIKSKDFYWLLINKIHTGLHAGPKRWTKSVPSSSINWQKVFSTIGKCSKEKKLREFHFKFIHRIVVTKKELFRFKLKEDGDCIYCGGADSIDHSFIDCVFTKSFSKKVLQWFNAVDASSFSPGVKELLFGLVNKSDVLARKLSYTLLFMRYYIFKRKLLTDSLLVSDFINQVIYKYRLEGLL